MLDPEVSTIKSIRNLAITCTLTMTFGLLAIIVNHDYYWGAILLTIGSAVTVVGFCKGLFRLNERQYEYSFENCPNHGKRPVPHDGTARFAYHGCDLADGEFPYTHFACVDCGHAFFDSHRPQYFELFQEHMPVHP